MQATYIENCGKCRGTGVFQFFNGARGQCFTCSGSGKQEFRKSAEERADDRAKRAIAAAKKQSLNWERFNKAYPGMAEWMTTSTLEFAKSLYESVRKHGFLSPRQMSAANACIEKLALRKAEAAQRKADAPVVDTAVIEQAFNKARTAVKWPKLRLGAYVLSLAGSTSANAGAIYIKGRDDGAYLGKVMGGKLFTVRECTAVQRDEVVALIADPQAAAIAYGKQFGECAVCGRELTDADSIAKGIGPVCEKRYF